MDFVDHGVNPLNKRDRPMFLIGATNIAINLGTIITYIGDWVTTSFRQTRNYW